MSTGAQSETEHVAQARHNEAFLDFLIAEVLPENGEYADWALVVLFYSALHYTKAAILRDTGKFSKKHVGHEDDQGNLFQGHNDLVRENLPVIKSKYLDMFEISTDARYRSYFKQPDSSFAEVKRQHTALQDIKLACGYA